MNIPKKIHYFWAGNNISKDGLRSIINVKAENPDFKVYLWGTKKHLFFNTINSLGIDIEPQLETGLSFHDSRDIEDAFLSLKQSPYFIDQKIIWRLHAIYHRQINGFYHNYASASDIVRLVILFVEGGIYLDVDIELANAVPKFSSNNTFHKIDQLLKRKAIFENINAAQGIAFGDVTGSGWTVNKFGNAIITAPIQSRKIAELLIVIDRRVQVMYEGTSKLKNNGWENWRSEPQLRKLGTLWTTGPGLYCGWFNQEKNRPSDAKRPRVVNESNKYIPSEHLRMEKEGEIMFNNIDAKAQWGKVREKNKDRPDYASESPFDLKSSYNDLFRK
ncbi:glycosyltransferase [Xenorhabdus lircayensis]|uniref:Uncharacterized protein n=1 Tax=Xenorhabdus lircayensis TaxID=2763499 RepID=A0ABS0U9B3_9GAMM|nr:glycosyltransferase [Xenorhabdus lircayensis]MBI6550468.1 hypothetical protein [Xenorhabdus lircayensis]